jgi:hypothetical protein
MAITKKIQPSPPPRRVTNQDAKQAKMMAAASWYQPIGEDSPLAPHHDHDDDHNDTYLQRTCHPNLPPAGSGDPIDPPLVSLPAAGRSEAPSRCGRGRTARPRSIAHWQGSRSPEGKLRRQDRWWPWQRVSCVCQARHLPMFHGYEHCWRREKNKIKRTRSATTGTAFGFISGLRSEGMACLASIISLIPLSSFPWIRPTYRFDDGDLFLKRRIGIELERGCTSLTALLHERSLDSSRLLRLALCGLHS